MSDFIKPEQTAETEYVLDENTGEVLQEIEHFRQGDHYYRIVHDKVRVVPEDENQSSTPVYDKYKLTLALEKANLLEDFMSFISSDPVLAFKWNAANQLDYEDDMLSNALAAIKEALDVTDEQVAAILAEAEA